MDSSTSCDPWHCGCFALLAAGKAPAPLRHFGNLSMKPFGYDKTNLVVSPLIPSIIYVYCTHISYIYIYHIYIRIYIYVHIPHVWSPIPLKNKQVVDSGFITDSRALKSSATRTRRSSSVQGLWLHHLVEGTHGHDVLTGRTGSLVTGDFMWLSTSVMVKAGWRGEKFF